MHEVNIKSLVNLSKIWLLLLAFSVSTYANPATVPFKMVNNLIIIQIDIEDNIGNFILDTGADGLLLNSVHRIPTNKLTTFQTVNGTITSEETTISHLKIGDITKENISAYNTNLSNIENFLNLEIAGIIGADFFNPHSILLDFENNVIQFYELAPEIRSFGFANHFDFNMDLGVPTTIVEIGNQFYTFIVDSGASIHLVDSKLVENHKTIFSEITSSLNVESVGHTGAASKFLIRQFFLNDWEVNDQTCLIKDFKEINSDDKPAVSGILSISKLTEKRILIDFHRMQMHF